MGPTTCAACGQLVIDLHPLWWDVSMAACLLVIIAALFIVNWTRWVNRDRT
jgi:hypothetical protein